MQRANEDVPFGVADGIGVRFSIEGAISNGCDEKNKQGGLPSTQKLRSQFVGRKSWVSPQLRSCSGNRGSRSGTNEAVVLF
jgi:hypothetical protein